jgi:ABC-type transport system involved in multi-copper enzyme maturation permease subunit
MTWPLIERELRAALRKRELPKVRVRGTMICAAFTALYLLANFASNTRDWGANLNSLLFWGGLIIIFQVPKYTVGIFSEERRNQTLGLLFLCGIGPGELFLSKTLGAALVSFSRLLIVYPFFAISFFGGGVSLDVFIATIVSLPVLLLFVFSVCVLASVLCEEESTAMFVAVLIGVLLCFGPTLVFSLADF